ncbi:tRNA delta(2)-isopentenylpyrophosphate transferase [Enterococcus hirae 57-03-H11]|uniref:tRNA (adenosine(37)-N6)-dimethylallyltransferase MiaA n=1 Tax=Enterococcus TaxID=1350 RepID=UPI0006B19D53|nr:tRNA (adenosine(37)-N6)-dimethylallyltransferase MiaA [Enterococcus hirae]OWW66737.1 tRNA delta(2)-isopentenylpyrophosphate transferase [Enterococcus hirae 57-03-H11]EMF0059828.1 tRNA (adenosine(37)-N6)-dimethylallyltransferase MiaA [Enterococcus hirae]EMF0164525.1 tRNA (adenosine(37)-N6)-dimethylallyltransferase MiaA [Enterococcus hirae]EMF0181872.1 tRNA (adenosine(37)-N6)-dimethylallyltransferase MiaA [Enterococcus hirae]EMF0197581.1 tRNA (adenosine(37)-N6)-dimethylallyltransferase MiaA [
MEKVLVIVGPTAVGKTALSVELAKKFNGEIISGDSLQVYKKLDIGTAKIKTSEMEGIPHHLIDVIEPNETYSVADFQKAGRKLITEITERGRLPMIVGGTGLYIQSLLYDFQLGAKEESVTAVRKKYEELAETLSKKELWEYLKTKDPLAAEKIHWNNQRKVIRALEVFEVTGYSITTPQEEPARLYDYCMIGLNTERALLYQRINQRVDSMLEEGLLEEARFVYELGEVQASQGIGYKEFYPYFKGEESLENVVEQLKMNSRRYAKRQLTWFRNRLDAHWFDLLAESSSMEQIDQLIRTWLEEKDDK